MDLLKDGKYDLCNDYLFKAENVLLSINELGEDTENNQFDIVNLKNKLLGLTYNNIGCLFK
jgi:hypothetical protein